MLTDQTCAYLAAEKPDFAGKTVLVTGGNGGVGYKTAETVVSAGGKVILACRSSEKANAARDALLSEYPQAEIGCMTLDLADMSSIRAFADALREKNADIDYFLHNAGVFHCPGAQTRDGLELVIGTNFVGTAALTECVLPHLLSLPHEVTLLFTVSVAYTLGKIDVRDFYLTKHYGNFRAYAQSKLATVRYAHILAERLRGTNVKPLMVHPGIAATGIARTLGERICALEAKTGLFLTAEEGALSTVYAAAHKKELPPAAIVGPRGFLHAWGKPAVNKPSRRATRDLDTFAEFTKKELRRLGVPENS